MTISQTTRGKEDARQLEEAFACIERHLNGRALRFARWVRSPAARWVRMPLGLLMIAQSVIFFLPLAGLHWLPFGLMLLAVDVPVLRRPAARMLLWLEARYVRWRERWRRARATRQAPR